MSTPNTVDTYLNLIPSTNRNQPNFIATITSVVSVCVQIQTLLISMIEIFDLDLPPVGNQLDIIGQWVGVSRNVDVPFTGVWFTWDDTVADGWDSGIWQDTSGGSSSITSLPDDIYLTVINAKIAKNNWDGTTDGIYILWAQLLPQYNLLIQDYQNMSFLVAIQGIVPDALTQLLIQYGYFVPRPEGIQITNYVFPVDTNPLFAWDVENSSMQGWDQGSWGNFVSPLS